MIADAVFGASEGRLRRWRFMPHASVPVETACAVANGVREALRELLGGRCELVLGEPAAPAPPAWSQLATGALLYLAGGGRTDLVIVLAERDARRLVLRAFGEDERAAPEALDAPWSRLERHALERIAARCAAAFDPLGARTGEPPRAARADEVPRCAAYFDLRVHEPVGLTIGVGVIDELPRPAPPSMLAPAVLDGVGVEMRAIFAEGTMDTAEFVNLRPGSVVKLGTKVGAAASLNCGSSRLATGVPGVVASRSAFLVHDVAGGVRG